MDQGQLATDQKIGNWRSVSRGRNTALRTRRCPMPYRNSVERSPPSILAPVMMLVSAAMMSGVFASVPASARGMVVTVRGVAVRIRTRIGAVSISIIRIVMPPASALIIAVVTRGSIRIVAIDVSIATAGVVRKNWSRKD